jgi:hypothetical protein
MRKQVPTVKEEIYCDICGKIIDENNSWSITIMKDYKVYSEYGNGFNHTGDWCENCRNKIINMIEEKLGELRLVERYSIDHSGKNETIEYYKEMLNN